MTCPRPCTIPTRHIMQSLVLSAVMLFLAGVPIISARVLHQQYVIINPQGQFQQQQVQQYVTQQVAQATQQVAQATAAAQATQNGYTSTQVMTVVQPGAQVQYVPAQATQQTYQPSSSGDSGQWDSTSNDDSNDSEDNSGSSNDADSSRDDSGGNSLNDPELQTVLDMHNDARAKHQVGSLSWSSQLQASAQQWANQCVFQHSGPGENLAQYFNDFRSACQAWLDEETNYRYDGQFSYTTGHFTQMMWKMSTQIGCGYQKSCQLYVCHYSPAGNVIGQFNENVFQPTQ